MTTALKTGHRVIAWNGSILTEKHTGVYMYKETHYEEDHVIGEYHYVLVDDDGLHRFTCCKLDPSAKSFLPGDNVVYSPKGTSGVWKDAQYVGYSTDGQHLVEEFGMVHKTRDVTYPGFLITENEKGKWLLDKEIREYIDKQADLAPCIVMHPDTPKKYKLHIHQHMDVNIADDTKIKTYFYKDIPVVFDYRVTTWKLLTYTHI